MSTLVGDDEIDLTDLEHVGRNGDDAAGSPDLDRETS